ncbi:DEAD/DEAH box helicase family protein [Halobacillus litoralis]|uniref:Restriction endonuclease subunit R n=1 Tax=Halobacillus litoralis TaxID=45668 RepID=A0A410MC50_9BACI|nr:DEAD/DEAH box helicase family protein [Halobacillus litoralis]QAS52319.1 restriction endonuclease subunit R [Halobacillus litoralis]
MTNHKNEIPFQKKLVLNKYFLNYFGFNSFNDIRKYFSDPLHEGISTEGESKFFNEYWKIFSEAPKTITKEDFAEYDQNLISHLKKINKNRKDKITLKYFQYFSLIFVEAYLDNFFANPTKLKHSLNSELNKQNEELGLKYSEYNDLNKLAIWSATGSGKTLLMHFNYFQIKYFLNKYNTKFDGSYILLTPSESLSSQHLDEYRDSSIQAERYIKDDVKLFSNADDIQVVENSKIGEKDIKETVAVSRFGNKNILFVDEGHRGSSGDSWYKYRNSLCSNGFSFEYSATFSQAVSKKRVLEEEYAKCILFDYSYKNFYEDGYGKDYSILNVPEKLESNLEIKYLIASLLSYYQQKKIYLDKKDIMFDYNIENPLLVFVGGNVTAREANSDVIEIVNFLSYFINNSEDSILAIHEILHGEAGLIDNRENDIFSGRFSYLVSKNLTPDEIYDDILSIIFHTDIRGHTLQVDNPTAVEGELRLKIGMNSSFGVINVGNDKNVLGIFEKLGITTNQVHFTDSLFDTINNKKSTINILIGSKKFSEGWNSWRVSTMGLMNVGQKEGSQIIQLFGRGVRLKGRNRDGKYSLKRSSAYHSDFRFEPKLPIEDMQLLSIVETLNIFGLRANYMQQFKNYLSNEGLHSENKTYEIVIPTVRTNYPKEKIKTIRVKNNLNFLKDAPAPAFNQYLAKPIILDTYGKVQFETSLNYKKYNGAQKELGKLDSRHYFGMDFEKIYFDLLDYKKEKKYWNVIFSLSDVEKILKNNSWYKLYIPKSELAVKLFKDFERFNRIGLSLMKKYIDKIYTVSKKKFEAPLLEYAPLRTNDPNFIDEYNVIIEDYESSLSSKNMLDNLREAIINDQFEQYKGISKVQGLEWIELKESLFNPLFYTAKDITDIKFVPTSLVESEWQFLKYYQTYKLKHEQFFKHREIYLIRNASRKGIGFFDDEGFYPDFIMWVFDRENEYIFFIEPHSLQYEDIINSAKINFSEKIKSLQNSIKISEGERPILESFIISPTPYESLFNPNGITKQELNDKNVLFFEDGEFVMEQILAKLHTDINS